jgi:putative copper resistance protein D
VLPAPVPNRGERITVLPSAPTWPTVLTAWTISPVADLLMVVGTVGYLRLASRGGTRWPARRTACWLLAMLTLVISVDGPVARYAEVLFWVHMAQHLLLIMVAPMLLIWAQPLRLVHAKGGARASGLAERVQRSRVARWLSAPLFGLGLYTAVVVLTHLTGFQQISATHGWVRGLELALYLVSGWLFFVSLAGDELIAWSLPYLLRFVVLAVGMGADTLTGVVLMLSSRPLAPVYGLAHPGWGPSLLRDQELAGAIMWFGGDLLMMLLMILVAVQWGRAGSDRQGLGDWLEGARRRAVLGADDNQPAGDYDGDLDDDQRALDAYNATLAALHAGEHPERRER